MGVKCKYKDHHYNSSNYNIYKNEMLMNIMMFGSLMTHIKNN